MSAILHPADLLASATRSSNTSTSDKRNNNAWGGILILNVTAASGTGGLTVVWETPVPGTDSTYAQLNADPTAITATGQFIYELSPGASGAGGTNEDVEQRVSGVLPQDWRATVKHGDGSNYTYSLSGYILRGG